MYFFEFCEESEIEQLKDIKLLLEMLTIADFLHMDNLIIILIIHHIMPKMTPETVITFIQYLNHKMNFRAEEQSN